MSYKKALNKDESSLLKKSLTMKEFLEIEDIPLVEGDAFKYEGSNMGLSIASFIYLIKKHKDNICYISTDPENFELQWFCVGSSRILVFPENFDEFFLNCVTKRRFVVIPVILQHNSSPNCTGRSDGLHQNMLIYDRDHDTLENFEPHGQSMDFDRDLFDTEIENYFVGNGLVSKYYSSNMICPRFGPQSRQDYERKLYDMHGGISHEGFCFMWSIWYIDLRLTFPDVPREVIQRDALTHLDDMGYNYFITNYTKFVFNYIRIIKEKYEDLLLNYRTIYGRNRGSLMLYKHILDSELKEL